MEPSQSEPQAVSTAPALWPDPDEGPFRLRFDWKIIDGRQEVVGIELSSIPAEEGWRNPKGWNPLPDLPPRPDRELPSDRELRLPPPTRLTSDILRMLTDGRAKSFTSMVEDTKESLIHFIQHLPYRTPEQDREIVERVKALEAGQRKLRGAPTKWGPDHYARVALVYETAFKSYQKPTKAVARHWGVKPSTAANWVAKARKLKFLGPTQRGKSGGIRPEKEEEE